jgi:hypothetical protein
MFITTLLLSTAALFGADNSANLEPRFFDTNDVTAGNADVPVIEPWHVVTLDPGHGGLWSVAGDVDGDGAVEIVSAKNVDDRDVHYTSAAVAHKLDGTVLWTWGDPTIGRRELHHDVALQIHDWDADGKNEVVLLTEGFLVELNGATGEERRRWPIPEEATDCLVFCDLSGKGHASDVLVKDRYHRIFAYNHAGELLWEVTDPGAYRTAHQPRPMDIDGDGRDEIMAGYAMLNPDGTVRWVFESEKVELRRGHLDCARILKRGETAAETQIALTCCGANNVAVVTGTGETLWEVAGDHYESINIGTVFAGHPGPQILVDVDHRPQGESPLRIFDAEGRLLGQIIGDSSRHHALVDWDGDGAQEFAVGHSGALFGQTGLRVATFNIPGSATTVFAADMDGDGVADLMFGKEDAVYLFRNTSAQAADPNLPLGTGLNVTLY